MKSDISGLLKQLRGEQKRIGQAISVRSFGIGGDSREAVGAWTDPSSRCHRIPWNVA